MKSSQESKCDCKLQNPLKSSVNRIQANYLTSIPPEITRKTNADFKGMEVN